VIGIVNEILRFGKISSSSLDGNQSVQCAVEGDEDEHSTDDNEVWGDAALLCKPTNGTECIYLQLGDEKVVLATKNRAFQISVSDGEVIVRALGAANAANVKLKKDGTAEINCTIVKVNATTEVNLGGTATQFAAMANLVTTQLNTLKTAISSGAITPSDGGAAFKASLVTALSAWPGVIAATKVKVQ
jgi:phage gp45-like